MRVFKRALITGITGSGGSYLAEHIVFNQPDVEVHGIARWHSTSTRKNVAAVVDRVTIHECDLNDLGSVYAVIQTVQPDAVFHMASHANVRTSFVTPVAVVTNNIVGTLNLCEAIRMAAIDPVVQVCSTSEVYGQVNQEEIPIKETCPLRPASPYALSKVTQDLLGYTYFLSYGMKIIRPRMFAYLNPRRADLFASAFARQVARIELGMQEELLHGNLDSVRTLLDVRDAVRAYWEAMLYCQPGEAYNIGGPTIISVGEFLNVLKKLSKVEIPSRVDPNLLRPADVTLQIPCIDKFVQATKWKPKYTFDESVEHLLNYWRRETLKEKLEQDATTK